MKYTVPINLGAMADRCQDATVWRGTGSLGSKNDWSLAGTVSLKLGQTTVAGIGASGSDRIKNGSYVASDQRMTITANDEGLTLAFTATLLGITFSPNVQLDPVGPVSFDVPLPTL
jgi:hypothetical protein